MIEAFHSHIESSVDRGTVKRKDNVILRNCNNFFFEIKIVRNLFLRMCTML